MARPVGSGGKTTREKIVSVLTRKDVKSAYLAVGVGNIARNTTKGLVNVEAEGLEGVRIEGKFHS